MRLLRALAHLVLALALIGAAFGPARAIGAGPAHAAHGNVDHHAAVAAEHAAHDHGGPASEHRHKADACQTLCCFVPSPLPPRAAEASAAAFFCAVRYRDAAEPRDGRADAPEPGIPKPAV